MSTKIKVKLVIRKVQKYILYIESTYNNAERINVLKYEIIGTVRIFFI